MRSKVLEQVPNLRNVADIDIRMSPLNEDNAEVISIREEGL